MQEILGSLPTALWKQGVLVQAIFLVLVCSPQVNREMLHICMYRSDIFVE